MTRPEKQPLAIGPIALSEPVALAPMAGWTDASFRAAVRAYSRALVVSEMIASREAIRAGMAQPRLTGDLASERPASVQIAGWDPAIMADAARFVRDHGAEIVDINMGCPAKKVTKKLAGAALMQDEALAGRILDSVVAAVDVPVTLKMRLGWIAGARNAPRLARIAESAGIRALAVHGRTADQKYGGAADWRAIRAVKRATRLPVFGNGDVRSVDDAAELLAQSGADGVMIGRGAQGRPWFPGQVAAFLRDGTRRPDPPAASILATLERHYDAMLQQYGVYSGVRRARKHLSCYLAGLPGATRLREAIFAAEEPVAVKRLIREAFRRAADRATDLVA